MAKPNRRQFFGQAGGVAATLAAGARTEGVASAQTLGMGGRATGMALPPGLTNKRMIDAFNLRVGEATQDALLPVAPNMTNGDDALYPDKAGTFTKGLPHDSFGRVDPAAYASFKTALESGQFSDFEKIIMGGDRTLNGPQGGLAFAMDVLDNVQFGQPQVPPAPPIAGDQSGAELVEHYWGALLRDVAFTDYGANPLAAMAAAELSGLPAYAGPRNSAGAVTPHLLFRGIFPGETLGPYISQFFITPTTSARSPSASRW